MEYTGKKEHVSQWLYFDKLGNSRAFCGLLPFHFIHDVKFSSKQPIQECAY
jgi:hypothetical protein